MSRIKELEAARQSALDKCKTAMQSLEISKTAHDPSLFQTIAQQANDAWLEYKRIELDINNYLTQKKMEDLYYA